MMQTSEEHAHFPIVIVDDAHTFGGAQIALAWAVRVILRETEERVVCVCTPTTWNAIRGVAGEHERLEFVECPSALPLNVLSFPFRLIPFLRIIARLRRRGVQAWWLNLSDIGFCLAPLWILKMYGERPRGWLHNTERAAFFTRDASRARRAISWARDRVADWWLFGLYPWLIAPSRSTQLGMEERISGNRSPRTGYLYYPTIGERPGAGLRAAERRGAKTETTIDLWMIGRIEYGHKNNVAAIEVLKAMDSVDEQAHLTVVGDGPDMADFRAKSTASGLADRITFLGWKTDPWDTVPRSAIVFIPSLYESMSLVAREAMMRRIRLIVSPIPVFREWIPDPFVASGFTTQEFMERVVAVHKMNEENISSLYQSALERFSDALFAENFMRYSGGEVAG